MTDWRPPILGTVTPGLERYCPLLAQQLDVMWPGHPPLYYALPQGRTAPYDLTIPTQETTWTAVLLAGLSFLRARGATHVFILLEDHVPLWPCDVDLVEDVCRIVAHEDLHCVFFTKWEWPWPLENEVLSVDRRQLARVPREFGFYNQCQPAIWKLGYYASLLTEAVRRGIADPWTFERFSLPDQPQHYVSDYTWPSRHCGFRRRGRVYLRALYSMKLPEGKALHDELLRERFPRVPPFLRQVIGQAFALWGWVRRMPARFERRRPMAARS